MCGITAYGVTAPLVGLLPAELPLAELLLAKSLDKQKRCVPH